jgi:hypothetical protein
VSSYKNLKEAADKQLALEKDFVESLELSAIYVELQFSKPNRCNELTNEDVINRIIALLAKDYFSALIRISLCQALGHYLKLSSSKELGETQLTTCASIINEEKSSQELKREALELVLLTAEKAKTLPTDIIQSLLANIAALPNDCIHLFIVTLHNIYKNPKTHMPAETIKLSQYLSDDTMIVKDGETIRFAARTRSNVDSMAVSTLAAELLVVLIEKQGKCDAESILNLSTALGSQVKQTKILSAKSLYLLAKSQNLTLAVLDSIRDYLNDPIPDVSIYCTVAYASGLAKLSAEPLPDYHIHELPSIYAFEDRRLGDESFSRNLNEKIFKTLVTQLENGWLFGKEIKKDLEEELFLFIEDVLKVNDPHQIQGLKFLDDCANKRFLPATTLEVLENLISVSAISDTIIKIFKKTIKNGQPVGNKVLQTISDNLFLNSNLMATDEALTLLEIADKNQEVADEIFKILELEQAVALLANKGGSKESATNAAGYVLHAISSGQNLTIKSFSVIEYLLKNTKHLRLLDKSILPILLNISNNKQNIPESIIDILIENFDPSLKVLIDLFKRLLVNNQDVSKKISLVLNTLADQHISVNADILSLFCLLAQAGERFPKKIVPQVLTLFEEEDYTIKRQALSAISFIIQDTQMVEEYYSEQGWFVSELRKMGGLSLVDKLQSVLGKALQKQEASFTLAAVNTFKIFIATYGKSRINKENIKALWDLATTNECQVVRQQAFAVLAEVDKSNLDETQRCGLKLQSLEIYSNHELLKTFLALKPLFLLPQNFEQISLVLDSELSLREKALRTLLQCKNLHRSTKKLVSSLSVLLVSNSDPLITPLCCQVMGEFLKNGVTIDITAELLYALLSFSVPEAKTVLDLIIANKLQPLPDQLKSQLWLLSKTDEEIIADKELLACLAHISKNLKTTGYVPGRILEKLQQIQSLEIQTNAVEVKETIARILAIGTGDRAGIAKQLQNAIISKSFDVNILRSYLSFIKHSSYQEAELEAIIQTLFSGLAEINDCKKMELAFISCIVTLFKHHGEIILFSENMFKQCIEVLEEYLNNENEALRKWAFKGLKYCSEQLYCSEAFEIFCQQIDITLQENLPGIAFEPETALIEVVAGLKHLDFETIIKQPQKQWLRSLLWSDLLATLKVSEAEKQQLCEAWLEVEENFSKQPEASCSILELLHELQYHQKLSFRQIFELINNLHKTDYETACDILRSSINPCVDLETARLNTEAAKLSSLLQNIFQQKTLATINPQYLNQLLYKMLSRSGASLTEKFLSSIKQQSVENLVEFETLIEFSCNNNIQLFDLYVKEASIYTLRRSLEIKFLGNKLKNLENGARFKLADNIDSLLGNSWDFDKLKKIFAQFKHSAKNLRLDEGRFLLVLEVLAQYKTTSNGNLEKVLAVLQGESDFWLKNINALVVENSFINPEQAKKTAEKLIEELKEKNPEFGSSIDEGKYLNWIKAASQRNIKSYFLPSNQLYQPICDWGYKDIKIWADKVKASSDLFLQQPDFIKELLAVLNQANCLNTGFYLTASQLLSCLIALEKSPDRGRLLQVTTGEGKTTIVSLLAVIYALQGRCVDIITSSPVLAERDAKQRASFYKMFSLECSDNNDRGVYISGPKDCYQKPIVYGEAAQFQFDTLRDKYSALNTLSGRVTAMAIVDEVDSMLIDDSSKIARLATTIPGMDQIQIIYHLLWHRLVLLQEKIIDINGQIFYFYGKLGFAENIVTLEYANQDGEIFKVEDIDGYVKANSNIDNIGVRIDEDFNSWIATHLNQHIKELLSSGKISVPSNFKAFVDSQLDKWIQSVLLAYNYQENVRYVIEQGLIKPVDYTSTGVVQNSTNWGDGLHQFLQVKHNLKMSCETLTTNFLSNVGYIKKYQQNLIGLTGTLGSDSAKKVLVDTYQVDLLNVTSLHKKQYLGLKDIIADNEKSWVDYICHAARNEAMKDRAVL